MINFRLKHFGKIIDYIKKHPTLPISATSLGLGGASLYVSHKNRKEGREDRRELIRVMKNLNNTLTKVDKHMDETTKKSSITPSNSNEENSGFGSMFNIFRLKNNSYTADYALKGGLIGASVAGTGAFFTDKYKGNPFGKFGEKFGMKDAGGNKSLQAKNALVFLAGSMLVGAALGAIWGGIKDYNEYKSQSNAANRDLLNQVVDNLERRGFKENKDFILSPKLATDYKTRVCAVISKTNEDLKIVVNSANDDKLKKASFDITRNLPKSATSTERLGDRFNELTITTLSQEEDAAFVVGILEQYIRRGFPVYIVEVG